MMRLPGKVGTAIIVYESHVQLQEYIFSLEV